MKAFELSAVLAAAAISAEQKKAKDGLRYLSSALSQLPQSKSATAALSELSAKLANVPSVAGDAAHFADIESAVRPLILLINVAGSKGAKESLAILAEIIARHSDKPVQSSENLLAPDQAAKAPRKVKPPAPPNVAVVSRHVGVLSDTRPGTAEFTAALAELNLELDEKRTKLTDLKAIAEKLDTPFPGKSRNSIMSALAREHHTVLETLTKIRSGSNAA